MQGRPPGRSYILLISCLYTTTSIRKYGKLKWRLEFGPTLKDGGSVEPTELAVAN